jgi:hypothetical protein
MAAQTPAGWPVYRTNAHSNHSFCFSAARHNTGRAGPNRAAISFAASNPLRTRAAEKQKEGVGWLSLAINRPPLRGLGGGAKRHRPNVEQQSRQAPSLAPSEGGPILQPHRPRVEHNSPIDRLLGLPYAGGMETKVRHHHARRLDVRALISNRVKSS